MGNSHYQDQQSSKPNSKLTANLPITSSIEEQYMLEILSKRPSLLQSAYVCSVKYHQIVEEQKRPINCQSSKKIIVYYDQYDFSLSQIPINSYTYSQGDICWLMYCIVQALLEYRSKKIHHGDISLQNIVKKGNNWQLVDKIFIRNGINAYQRVLQGQEGFVSPLQMQRIRHGFIRESPQIEQADDIFSLGMIALQLGCKKPSNKCYRQSFNRFYQKLIEQNLRITQNNYSPNLANLIRSMIQMQEQDRITLDGIRKNPIIFNINKYSLKQHNVFNNNTFSNNKQQSRISSASKFMMAPYPNNNTHNSKFLSPNHYNTNNKNHQMRNTKTISLAQSQKKQPFYSPQNSGYYSGTFPNKK